MRRYVFAKKPDYCVSFRPGLIVVHCHKCGEPHEESFGNTSHDVRDAEIAMLHKALDRASSIIERLGSGGKTRARAHRRKVHVHT